MTISKEAAQQFERLQLASEIGMLCLIEAQHKATGEVHNLIAVVIRAGDDFQMDCIARLVGPTWADEYLPPQTGGDFGYNDVRVEEI